MRIFCLLLISLFSSFMVYSQQELNDTTFNHIKIYPDSVVNSSGKINSKLNGHETSNQSGLKFNQSIDSITVDKSNADLELNVPDLTFMPGQASLLTWRGGTLVATGGTMVMPGLMQIDSGSIGIFQQFGRFSLYAGATANKYGYFRGLHTQYGLNGSLSYMISPSLSVTAFGTYYFGMPPTMANGMPMPASMAGYYGVSKFGGYVNYDADEKFGVEVGGQAVQQIGTQKYELEPIVTPYVKLGSGKKKIKIGLPVGQILHGILRR